MSEENSTKIERLANGKFMKGHKGLPGAGNPHAAKVEALRKAMYAAVDKNDLKAVFTKLLLEAKNGNVKAASLLFAYLLGRPKEQIEVNMNSDMDYLKVQIELMKNTTFVEKTNGTD